MVSITDWWHDVVRPLLLFSVSMLYACLPVFIVIFVCFRYVFTGPRTSPVSIVTMLIIAVASGLLFWPMLILNMALGDSFFPRPHRVILSIIRALGPYLACCACLYVSAALVYYSTASAAMETQSVIVLALALQIAGLCVEIYAMRAIGLLYRHYEQHMDW